MSVAINPDHLQNATQVNLKDLEWLYPEIQEADVIPNFRKLEKRAAKAFSGKHATNVVNTYIAISDDKLSREQIRRHNRKPRKITHRTVEDREFLGIYS